MSRALIVVGCACLVEVLFWSLVIFDCYFVMIVQELFVDL